MSKRRLWRWCIVLFVTLAMLKSTGCALGRHALVRDAARWPRHPQTGVIVGAETLDLGDPRSATACLLLHGFIGTVSDFNQLPQRLADAGCYVRVLRLPGHGTSPEDLEEQTADALYAAVREEYDRLADRYAAVDVVGFSMGGALATLLASERPVHRLVLIAPYYDVPMRWYYVLPPHWWNHLVGRAFHFLPKWRPFVCVNKKESKGAWPTYGAVSTKSVRMAEELGRRARQREVLAKVTTPVLHLHAKPDRAASPKAARKAVAAMASTDKQSVWYTRSNHILLWDYDAEDVEERVVEFIRDER